MAIYHLHVGIVSRSSGRSSVAAAAYRAAEKLKNEHDGITHDYSNRSSVHAAAYRSGENLNGHDFTNKRGVVYSEIILPQNAPKEYSDRAILWNAVEKSEKRKDAQTARDIDVALPVELDRQEQIDLMREYIQDNFVKHGMIADFAIHDKNDGNPHAHILLTTRNVDESGFKGKNRDWNKKPYLMMWRKNWAVMCNDKLHEKGINKRIDHRTLEAQGVDREPTIHVGLSEERAKQNREIIECNKAKTPENTAQYIHELKQGYIILDKEITVLNQEIVEAERESRVLKYQAEKIDEHAPQVRDQHGRTHFKRLYGIEPEQASEEIKRLEDRVRSLEHLKAKLQEKLTPFVEERWLFESEYKQRRQFAEVRHDWQKMHERLTELDKITYANETPKERLLRVQIERTLDDTIAEKISQRERTRERERDFTRYR